MRLKGGEAQPPLFASANSLPLPLSEGELKGVPRSETQGFIHHQQPQTTTTTHHSPSFKSQKSQFNLTPTTYVVI